MIDGEPQQELDRRIVMATQNGLPLDTQPYHWIAKELGIAPETVIERMQVMLDDGRIRRIGVVPNHYRLGYTANGMSVWDIADDEIKAIGRKVGDLDIVSHCYQRPRHLPNWPYNMFAMVHGSSRQEVIDKVSAIASLLNGKARSYDILFSTRILKKTGLRLSGD